MKQMPWKALQVPTQPGAAAAGSTSLPAARPWRTPHTEWLEVLRRGQEFTWTVLLGLSERTHYVVRQTSPAGFGIFYVELPPSSPPTEPGAESDEDTSWFWTPERQKGNWAVEMDWLAEHGNELAKRYAGQWIAISGAQLVASAPNLRTLLKRAAKAGHPDPLITAMPAEPVLRLHV